MGELLGIPPSSVVVTASFTTLDTETVLRTAAEMATAGPSVIEQMLTPVPLPVAPGVTLPPGTPVRMIDQPWLAGWQDGHLHFEAHEPLEDGNQDLSAGLEQLRVRAGDRAVDWERVAMLGESAMGLPLPVSAGSPEPAQWLAAAPRVENRARGNFRDVEPEDEPAPEQLARAGRE